MVTFPQGFPPWGKIFPTVRPLKWFEQTEELKRLWESYHPEKVLTIDDLKNAVNAQEEEEEEEVDDFDENDNESKDESSRHI